MGKYTDILDNLTIKEYNASIPDKTDWFTEAVDVSKEQSNNNIGAILLGFLYFVLYVHIVKEENKFNLSEVNSFIATSTIILCLAIIFVYIEILSTMQVFIWVVLGLFFVTSWGILRSSA